LAGQPLALGKQQLDEDRLTRWETEVSLLVLRTCQQYYSSGLFRGLDGPFEQTQEKAHRG
jgi:hypothetical protein